MKILSITSTHTPVVNFKKLYEQKDTKYTHKQETLTSQVKDLFRQTCPIDKKARTWDKYFEQEYGLDIIIEPSKTKRKEIYVSTYNKRFNEHDLLDSYTNVKKPKESSLIDFVGYLEEKNKEAGCKLIMPFLIFGLIAYVALFCPKGNVAAQKITKDAIKTEIKTKALTSLKKDTIELITKNIYR